MYWLERDRGIEDSPLHVLDQLVLLVGLVLELVQGLLLFLDVVLQLLDDLVLVLQGELLVAADGVEVVDLLHVLAGEPLQLFEFLLSPEEFLLEEVPLLLDLGADELEFLDLLLGFLQLGVGDHYGGGVFFIVDAALVHAVGVVVEGPVEFASIDVHFEFKLINTQEI